MSPVGADGWSLTSNLSLSTVTLFVINSVTSGRPETISLFLEDALVWRAFGMVMCVHDWDCKSSCIRQRKTASKLKYGVGYMEYSRENSAFTDACYQFVLISYHSATCKPHSLLQLAVHFGPWYVVTSLVRTRPLWISSLQPLTLQHFLSLSHKFPNALSYCDICSQLKLVDRPPLTRYDRLERVRISTHLRVIMTL